MEKFPKGEMGWVSESAVKEYIDRNYIPRERYGNLRAEYAKLLAEKNEFQNALDYFVDDLFNYSGVREVMRSAIKGGFTPEFIWKHIYADEELYEEIAKTLTAECDDDGTDEE